MKPTVLLIGAAAWLLGTTLGAQAPAGDVDSHIAAARTAAGQDYRNTFINLCLASTPPGGGRGGAGRGAAGRGGAPATPDRAGWYASPYKIFDNLYWLGTRQHSSWALRTSEGSKCSMARTTSGTTSIASAAS